MTRQQHLGITVAALTRKRPDMLGALLQSWGAMALPDNTTIRCLIVENDEAPHSEAAVAAQRPLANGATLDYVLEPEPGIPFGRNRAAREAIAAGHDLLVFVDDDEIVAPDWLERLVAGYRASDAVLMGAPLRVADPVPGLGLGERMMHRNIVARYARKENRAARRADLHATPGVTIVTNNWLGETRLFTEHGLWFDEAMRFTGGTDSKFYAEARALGLPTGWVADAFVYETVPAERLSFAYQFARGRDQSNTNFRRKIEKRPAARWSALVSVPLKCVAALALGLAVPLTGGRTLLDFARTSGWIAGRVGGFFGRRSALYERITGS